MFERMKHGAFALFGLTNGDRCAGCKKRETAKSMQRHVYIIPKRSKPLSGNRYCSLKCLEDHLTVTENSEWVAIGETTSCDVGGGGLCIHRVAVSEREKSEHSFRHRDSGEMHWSPDPKKKEVNASAHPAPAT